MKEREKEGAREGRERESERGRAWQEEEEEEKNIKWRRKNVRCSCSFNKLEKV